MFDPAQLPRIDTRLLRGIFRGHIARGAERIMYRGEYMVAAINEPSLQKQVAFGAFSQDTVDLEMMLALPAGSEAPKPNSSEEIRIFSDAEAQVYTAYRIVSVKKQEANDCYVLALAVKKSSRA